MFIFSDSSKKSLAFFNPLFVRFCFGIGLIAMAASSQTTDIALHRTATSSSNENTINVPGNAVDGNAATRWSSAYSDPQWIKIDLGSSYSINRVALTWEAASAKNYTIDVSANGTSWTTISTKVNMATGARTDNITGLSGVGRYIRMNGTARTTAYGYSIYTFAVYGTPQTNYSLTTTISPAGTGSITLNPAGGTYASGTVVTVTTNPNDGYDFVGWSGDLTGPVNPQTITMNGAKKITANFSPEVFDKHAYYRITNRVGTTGVIDNSNAKNGNGAQIFKKVFDAGLPGIQQWRIVCTGTKGLYKFASGYDTSFVLDNTGSTTDGATMTQWSGSGAATNINQQWSINNMGNGYYQIVSKKSNMALDNRDPTYLKQKTISSTENNEQWKIEKVQWTQSKFIVAGFVGPVFSGNTDTNNVTLVNQDKAALQIAKDAGFNLMVTQMQCASNASAYLGDAGSKYTFTIAQKVGGIQLMYQHSNYAYGWYTQGVDEIAYPSASSCLKLSGKNRSGQYGYFISDEPVPDGTLDQYGNVITKNVSNVKNWLKDFRINDPGKLGYFNLGYSIPFDAYVEAAVNDVDPFKRPDVSSYDCYSPFADGSIQPMYFSLMNTMRTKMGGRTWFNYALAIQHSYPAGNVYYMPPSEATLRFNVFTSVAYGAKGIAYFTYEQPQSGGGWNYGTSMVSNGVKNDEYYWVQRINRYLADFVGPAAIASNTPSVYHSSNTLYSEALPADQILKDPWFQQWNWNSQVVQWIGGTSNWGLVAPIMAGVFQDKTTPTTYYVLLVNKDFNNYYSPITITFNHDCRNNIQFAPSVTTYDGTQKWAAPDPTTVEYPSLSGAAGTDIFLDFAPGEGRLVKITNVTNPLYTGN
jgi:uncharacterized repeat protein (TIGR02543 family)